MALVGPGPPTPGRRPRADPALLDLVEASAAYVRAGRQFLAGWRNAYYADLEVTFGRPALPAACH